jgi:hypothetical protein
MSPERQLYHPRFDERSRAVSHLEHFARLDQLDCLPLWIVHEMPTKAIHSVECTGCDMMKRSPVVWNEETSLEELEEFQRILRGEVATPKSWLPPWSMSNWE